MKRWFPVNDMLWTPDRNYEEARKLPEWGAFHRLCGKHGLCFDFPEREGRGYRMVAFTPEKTAAGGWRSVPLATGRGGTILAAMGQAYELCGRTVPGAAEMLARGLAGPEKSEPPGEIDTLFGEPAAAADAFEDLLG